MNEKKIYTRWLAVELIRAGFPVVRVEKNIDKPQFNVWVFAATADFEVAFANLANSKH